MPPITARFKWTADDLAVGRKFFGRTAGNSVLWFVLIFLTVIFTSLKFLLGNRFEVVLVVAGIFGFATFVGITIVTRLVRPYLLKREFASRHDAHEEIEWQFSQQQITINSTDGKSDLQWSAFQKVLSTPAGFLFLSTAQIFHFVPRRAFASEADIEFVISLARTHAREFKELK
ncbi:MAG: YcxB family protein [Armatimonadetes bacterium]|nr:YcxB family protein [Akkermansiaceae bacterium]